MKCLKDQVLNDKVDRYIIIMYDQIILLLILLVLSGFFSSSETALFSISKAKARYLAKEGNKSLHLIKKMKEDPHTLLSTILIGNNVVNVGASAIATSITINTFSSYAVGAATGIMTFLILVFGEVFPKSIATRNNIIVAKITIFPLYWLSFIFYPLIKLLNFIPLLTGKISRTPAVTEEELLTFVEAVEEGGEIKEEEKELIHNIFEFDDTNASEIMTPRGDMFVVNSDEPINLVNIINSGFSRIPVIDKDLDHIIGIITIKDLFSQQITSDGQIDLNNIMLEPYFVPEYIKLDRLLHMFKIRKHHMAIVVDEHGGVSGLITLEDAIEEIVGEIVDETDKEESHITRLKKNEWLVLGKTDIDEVNDKIKMNIQDSNEYDTFSGYILYKIGRIPIEKELITLGNYDITIEEMESNRLIKHIVKLKKPLQ